MNFFTAFRSESGTYQQFTDNEKTFGASTQPATGSSTVSLASVKHPAHTAQIDPFQNLVRQIPVGNRTVETKTNPLCQNKSDTTAGVKAHGRSGSTTKAERKQATEDLRNALTCTKDLDDLSNDDILALIKKGANINEKINDSVRETVLHKAALRGNKRIIELLVNEGADVNAKTYCGSTVMQLAYQNGSITPLIRCMVNAGLKINTTCDKYGATMLAHAAREDNWELVEFLLDKGAKVNDEIDNDGTALHLAVRRGQPENINMLMKHRAKINARNLREGKTALHFAARLGQSDTINLLIRYGADISARDNNGETALHHTASLDRPEIIDQLTGYGADINARDNKGRMLLHLVAGSGQRAILDKLLELDVDVNARDNNGRTPLYLLTCTNGQLDTIQYFMNALTGKQADVNHRDSYGSTPLAFLVRSLRDQSAINSVIETLTLHGANVNDSDSRGVTPLHIAANQGKLDVFNRLLEKGANMSARTSDGKMVLDVAESSGQNRAKMLVSLFNAGLDVNAPCTSEGATMLVCGALNGQWDLVDILKSHGANIDAWKNEATQFNALHYAALHDRKDMVSNLLKRNANSTITSQDGSSAIHYAMLDTGLADLPTPADLANRRSLLVDLIENDKSNINAQNKRGMTALHLAASGGIVEIVAELLKQGADFNILDEKNMTAYDYCCMHDCGLLERASKKGREKACQLMIDNNANVRGADLIKAEASGRERSLSRLAHKVKESLKTFQKR